MGLTLNALVDLQALGLIEMSFDDGSYCYFSEDKKKRVVINYYDHTYELPEGMSTCSVGNIVFTKAGQALCKAIIVEEQKGFWENECLPIWEKEVKIFLLEQSKEKKNEQ